MKLNIYDYVSRKKENLIKDIDFHDVMEMNEAGLSDDEMSRELGIPKSYVGKIMEDIRRDY